MPDTPAIQTLEHQLITEMRRIQREIGALQAEFKALERTLDRVYSDRLGARAVSRKNSRGRILAENDIVQAIQRSRNRRLSTESLLRHEREINPDINPSTFRSHLHRMKLRGLIVQRDGRGGYWELPDQMKVGN